MPVYKPPHGHRLMSIRIRGWGMSGVRGLMHSIGTFLIDCRAKMRNSPWAKIIPWLVTVGALVFIAWTVPWTDHVELVPTVDPSPASVNAHVGHESSNAAPTHTPATLLQPGVLSILRRAHWIWLIACFGCMAASAVLLVRRWHLLLSQSGPAPSIAWCARTWAQSQVISILPFGQIGADAYRIERSARVGPTLGRCVGIIAIERIMGFMALGLVACTGWAIHVGGSTGLLLVLAESIFAMSVIAWIPRLRVLQPVDGSPGESTPWRKKLARLVEPVSELARRPYQLAWILFLSIGVQTLTPITFFAVDRALGLDTPVWCYLVAVPTVILAQFLPIHVAGIGILEGGLWAFLGPWAGRTTAEVVALSAAIRILNLSWSALLAASFLTSTAPIAQSPSRARTAPPSAHNSKPSLSEMPVELLPEGTSRTSTAAAAGPACPSRAMSPFPTRSHVCEL